MSPGEYRRYYTPTGGAAARDAAEEATGPVAIEVLAPAWPACGSARRSTPTGRTPAGSATRRSPRSLTSTASRTTSHTSRRPRSRSAGSSTTRRVYARRRGARRAGHRAPTSSTSAGRSPRSGRSAWTPTRRTTTSAGCSWTRSSSGRTRRHAPGVRLLQIAYHNRSLSLYAKLGMEVRGSFAAMYGTPIRRCSRATTSAPPRSTTSTPATRCACGSTATRARARSARRSRRGPRGSWSGSGGSPATRRGSGTSRTRSPRRTTTSGR